MEVSLGKAMLPYKMQQLLDVIIRKRNLGVEDALHYLYTSDLYKLLSSESSELWKYSSLYLYDFLKQEKLKKKQSQETTPPFLLFYIFCFENYKDKKQLSIEETLYVFNKYKVLDFLQSVYEELHTQGKEYIIAEIETYINNRK